jgi:hypothetical protein
MTVKKRQVPVLGQELLQQLHAATVTAGTRLTTLSNDLARYSDRVETAERMKARLAATREELAVQVSHVRRLLAEKQLLCAMVDNLKQQIDARGGTTD